MTSATEKGVITHREFHESREYLALTAKQRVWIDSFIASQDAALATRTAYQSESTSYSKLFTYKMEANSRIQAALNLFFGRSPREVFLQELEKDIRRSPKGSIARIQAQNLYARMAFGDETENPSVPSAEPEPLIQKFSIGEQFKQAGVKYRVEAVEIS
jgi:hypothetical protein